MQAIATQALTPQPAQASVADFTDYRVVHIGLDTRQTPHQGEPKVQRRVSDSDRDSERPEVLQAAIRCLELAVMWGDAAQKRQARAYIEQDRARLAALGVLA